MTKILSNLHVDGPSDLMQTRQGQAFDKDGGVARRGTVEQGALELFLAEPYFARMPPKSLDRNDFAEMIALVRELSDADAAATLTGMAAAGVVQGLDHCPSAPESVHQGEDRSRCHRAGRAPGDRR